jgi:regulatory protein
MGLAVGVQLADSAGRLLAGDTEGSAKKRPDDEKAREAALRLLSVRARSRWELSDRLKRKGFDTPTRDRVLSVLEAAGLVDDREFARLWAEERLRLRPVGRMLLVSELRAKRVAEETIAATVDEVYEEHREIDLATAVLKKRLGRIGTAGDRCARSRLESHLLRRGFSFEVVAEAMRQIEGEVNE